MTSTYARPCTALNINPCLEFPVISHLQISPICHTKISHSEFRLTSLWEHEADPVNIKHLYNISTMLYQRPRRWAVVVQNNYRYTNNLCLLTSQQFHVTVISLWYQIVDFVGIQILQLTIVILHSGHLKCWWYKIYMCKPTTTTLMYVKY